MKKPLVICHMMSTIDGRIIVENWGHREKAKTFSGIYEKCHESFKGQAWMVGRVTMEKDFTEGKKPVLKKGRHVAARDKFIADPQASSFAIAVDPKGKLGWEANEIDGDHIIELLSEQVSNAYLNYLQQKSISYIIAGKKEIDFKLALKQLSRHFPIQTIMLEGGGHINGSMVNAGLIDEISLLIIPLVDGTAKSPTTFEISEYLKKGAAQKFQLSNVKKMKEGVVWLKYRAK